MKGIAKTSIKRDARTSSQPHLFIGIGGSAGGLAAYASFLAQLPVDSGFSYILAGDPAAQHPDNLAELLQSHTSMPIEMAMDGAAIAANQIYLIPPGARLTISSGYLDVESSKSDAMTFRETGQGETDPADTSALAGSESGHQQLEPELRQTKAQLQSTINKFTRSAGRRHG